MPNAGPGLSRPKLAGGYDPAAIAKGLGSGELSALYLLGVDPLLSYPDAPAWERALEHATTVVAHASFLTKGLREHATVIFPSESSAEKEGTITHPDGRVQRLRPAIGHVDEVRSEWRVLRELGRMLGGQIGPDTAAALSAELFAAVDLYRGLTLENLAGHGIRWQEQAVEASFGDAARIGAAKLRRAPRQQSGKVLLGSYRSIWAGAEVKASPALAFLAPSQRVELNPADADALGLRHDEQVVVSDEHGEVRGRVVVRDSAPIGTGFLERGLDDDGANMLHGPHITIRSLQSVEAEAAALLAAEEQALREAEQSEVSAL
jgi:NADH-quinone oxidoreductase subunit G